MCTYTVHCYKLLCTTGACNAHMGYSTHATPTLVCVLTVYVHSPTNSVHCRRTLPCWVHLQCTQCTCTVHRWVHSQCKLQEHTLFSYAREVYFMPTRHVITFCCGKILLTRFQKPWYWCTWWWKMYASSISELLFGNIGASRKLSEQQWRHRKNLHSTANSNEAIEQCWSRKLRIAAFLGKINDHWSHITHV